jgi:hypothetical protein
VKYLVIDARFGTAIHVFLEHHPGTADGFPGLLVREVELEPLPDSAARGRFGSGVGQDPCDPRAFREFQSDRAVAAAGYGLVEPRFVGTSWGQYEKSFRPAGGGTKSKGKKPDPASKYAWT